MTRNARGSSTPVLCAAGQSRVGSNRARCHCGLHFRSSMLVTNCSALLLLQAGRSAAQFTLTVCRRMEQYCSILPDRTAVHLSHLRLDELTVLRRTQESGGVARALSV